MQKLWNALSSDMTAVKESERMLLVGLLADSCSCAMWHQLSGRVKLSTSRLSSLIWVNEHCIVLQGGTPPPLAVTMKVSTSGGTMASICGTIALVLAGFCTTRVICSLVAMLLVTIPRI